MNGLTRPTASTTSAQSSSNFASLSGGFGAVAGTLSARVDPRFDAVASAVAGAGAGAGAGATGAGTASARGAAAANGAGVGMADNAAVAPAPFRSCRNCSSTASISTAWRAWIAFNSEISIRIFFEAASRNRPSQWARTSMIRVSASGVTLLHCSASATASASDASSNFRSPPETW